jgi:hypothetical protein
MTATKLRGHDDVPDLACSVTSVDLDVQLAVDVNVNIKP